MLGIELRDPITKELIEVQSLSQPLKLSFIITSVPDGKKLGCVYFDEEERIWLTTGLHAVTTPADTLVCESTHATFFAPSHESFSVVEGGSALVISLYVPACRMLSVLYSPASLNFEWK